MKRYLNTPLGIFIATLVVAGFLGYALKASGFHFQGIKIVRGGDIAIERFDTNIQVVINEKTVSVENSGIVTNVKPGVHEVIVFKDGFWPWVKEVSVESEERVLISPFLASKSITGTIIGTDDPEYQNIRQAVLANRLPTESTPITSPDGNLTVWSDATTIIGTPKGGESFVIFEGNAAFRNVAFYQDRSDVLLVATQNGVFALEIDSGGGTQNFQPIYKGSSEPRFTPIDSNSIYVEDSGLIFIVEI